MIEIYIYIYIYTQTRERERERESAEDLTFSRIPQKGKAKN